MSMRSVQQMLLLEARYDDSFIVRVGVALYALARTVHEATRSHTFDKGSSFVSRTLHMHTMEITEGTKARRIILGVA